MLWIIILIIAIIAVSGFYFWYTKRTPTSAQIKIVTDIIFSLVLEAEKQLRGSKTGQAKFAQVVRDFMRECPAWLQKFVTAETLTDWIEEAVERMKDYFKKYPSAEKVFTGGGGDEDII